MSQSDVMRAEIDARNKITDAEVMKAKYEAMLLELVSKVTTQAKAAPASSRHNPKLLLTRSV